MISLLLFSISLTIRASNAQTKIKILHCAHAQKKMGRMNYKNAAENYFLKKSRIFWLGQNMENDVNS